MSQAEQDAAAKERKKRYKKTLNLPKTSFPMRANLAQNEPQSQKRWDKIDLYKRVIETHEQAGGAPYWFHDGPPYANGTIHVGHLLNKVLKDLVVRTRNMAGRPCPYIPGWDCHGLPIEHKVMTELAASGKLDKLNDLAEDTRRMAIRRECHKYASKFKKLQVEQMRRLHTLADYDAPYLTMTKDYEQKVLEVFAGLVDQGIIYRDLKPVHWSIANETALAEAELEYYDRVDPSIYVWFEAADPAALASCFGVTGDLPGAQPPAFMIWTTTPWTLPANLLIAVHETFDYVLVTLGDRTGVVAKERLEAVAKATGTDPDAATVHGICKGKDLLELEYKHPFVASSERTRAGFKLVAADYVTTEDGTGLVHTAPGHGADDYHTGLRTGVPVYCPVQGDGTYDDTVPETYRGQSIWDANPKILAALQASGHLYFHHDYNHSYPHDWRSKTPVVFRATEQWFAAVDQPMSEWNKSLRQSALAVTESEVGFVPEWGRNRMRGMIESRPDWCLSRQRSWGLPIPAFRLPDGTVFLTAASVRAVAEAFGREGSDAWFERSAGDLLADWDPAADPEAPDALRSGAVNKTDVHKLYDIFDVWFESGSSWNAVMRAREQGYPTDLYLEGSDQHRGWFQASLLPALGVTGQSPFRTVLTHGFMVDKDGKKMSKSGGNALEVEELLKDFGADVCRWWVSSLPFENDIKVDIDFFHNMGESYRKVRNTLRFLLSNLADFDPAVHSVAGSDIDPTSIDAWAFDQTAALKTSVTDAYEAFDFRRAHLTLYDFCNDTMSAVYLDAVKDRLYCDQADSPRRRATQSTLFQVSKVLITLLAPILPHTADEAWRALFGTQGPEDTVHTEVYASPSFNQAGATAVRAGWQAVFAAREQVDKALEDAKANGIENPLDAGVSVPDPKGQLAPFTSDLPDLFGVSRVTLSQTGEIEVHDLRDQPRCERSWKRDLTVKERSDGGMLSDRDALAVGVS